MLEVKTEDDQRISVKTLLTVEQQLAIRRDQCGYIEPTSLHYGGVIFDYLTKALICNKACVTLKKTAS